MHAWSSHIHKMIYNRNLINLDFIHITYILLYSSNLLAGVSFVEKSDGTDLFDFI